MTPSQLAPTPKMPLHLIEETLLKLSTEREAAIYEGDSEALAVIEAEIGAYLTQEGCKIDSYCALIRQKQDVQDAARKERDRSDAILKAAEAEEKRLKEIALSVLRQFGVRELRNNKTGNFLRIQGNGGLQPLEVTGAFSEWDDSPKYETITTTMPFDKWICLVAGQCGEDEIVALERGACIKPDNDAIREALKRGEEVPGAKLLPRGEQLRCS